VELADQIGRHHDIASAVRAYDVRRRQALAPRQAAARESMGDGGDELGTTVAQQLALARLLLADPAVAVLDEATAEAGSIGSRLLERAADAALDGRTAVVIAHRLTQARAADRIVVLDAGRVVEAGTHDELVARGGHYAALWAAWSRRAPRT
jgi:ATP-binding cassette subfamily C protein